jgi:hypothetical protein
MQLTPIPILRLMLEKTDHTKIDHDKELIHRSVMKFLKGHFKIIAVCYKSLTVDLRSKLINTNPS